MPVNDLLAFWTTMVTADRHVFQVLTKRPGLARWAKFEHSKLPLPRHIWTGSVASSPTEMDRKSRRSSRRSWSGYPDAARANKWGAPDSHGSGVPEDP